MKTEHYIKKRLLSIVLTVFVTGLFYGCQTEVLESENDELNHLKNAQVQVDPTGSLPGGASYEIQLPAAWNYLPLKVLVVYAHGYVNPGSPIALPNDSVSGISVKDLIMNYPQLPLGYASTSYRDNGLVVLDAIEDIKQLRVMIDDFFNQPLATYLPPDAVLLVGVSEGGLITTLTIEQNPTLFDAAIATCCPIGNFYDQLQYYGDAHVLFKYFFGPSFNDINIGSPKHISKNTIDAWIDKSLQAGIIEALRYDYMYNNGNKVRQYLKCAKIPSDMQTQEPEEIAQTILEVLRFPIMATNDAIERLNGNPYNNKYPKKMYEGSDNDRKLNLTVERIYRKGWEQAVENVMDYETTGMLLCPLLTMHTEFDHVSMYSHQILYMEKVATNSPYPSLLTHIPIPGRYGHCSFTLGEIQIALQTLLSNFQQP